MTPERPRRTPSPGTLALTALAVAAIVWSWLRGPFGQDVAYHDFADQRPFLGVPHALNVLSNAPFLLVGVAGLAFLAGPRAHKRFLGPSERRAFVAFFLAVALTGVGSAYYHLDPTNARLVWDRLPMAVAFMALLAAVVDDRLGPPRGTRLLPWLVVAGVGSVGYWDWTERRGTGDLRPYFLAQYGTLQVLVALLVFFRPSYTGSRWLYAALAWYVVAKVCEHPLDGPLFARSGWVSGHTLKHLAAAASTYCVLRWMTTRAAVEPTSDKSQNSL